MVMVVESVERTRAMRSVRTMILVRLSLFLALVFSALWVIVAERSHKALYTALDEAVMARAQGLASLLSFDMQSGILSLEQNERFLAEFSENEDEAFFQIRGLKDGRVYFLSPSLKGRPFNSARLGKYEKKEKKHIAWNDVCRRENVRCLRWLIRPEVVKSGTSAVSPPVRIFKSEIVSPAQRDGAPPLEILLCVEREKVDRSYSEILGYTGGAFFLILFLVLGATNLLLKYSLRSLTRLSHEVDQIQSLPHTTPLSRWGDRETDIVAAAVNSLLERLAKSVEWERQMTASLAHELRTPLAALRSVLEVSLMRERGVGEYRETAEESLALVSQMQLMIENLLQLARLESGQVKIEYEALNLTDLIRECWALFHVRAGEKSIRIDSGPEEDLNVVSDRGKLRIVLNNIFDNAVEYTQERGTIYIGARPLSDGSRCEVIVENSGEPLSEEELENIFKRFYRRDEAREGGHHWGVGLSLVRSIAGLLGMQIEATSRQGIALSLKLSIPACPPNETKIP
ncbi:MAG: HAMP domain-containing sensor histidine kinase [Candidatus Sumerlaeota bacterium]|nr:HAMP domain-containing sensor histidine kinase [Candidatus Sumerlaeota bacterium]